MNYIIEDNNGCYLSEKFGLSFTKKQNKARRFSSADSAAAWLDKFVTPSRRKHFHIIADYDAPEVLGRLYFNDLIRSINVPHAK
jgi:hypothetical protein